MGLGACALAREAHADPRYALTWDAPSACATSAQVDRAIRSWLDDDGASPSSPVRAEAQVNRGASGWELDLTLTSGAGATHEQFLADACDALVDLLAIKVALAVNPLGRGRKESPAPKAEPPALRVRTVFGLRGSVGGEWGALPGAGLALGLAASLERGNLRVELGGMYASPRTARYAALPGVGADLSLMVFDARGCLVPHLGPVAFPLCAVAEFGVLKGSGFGVAHTADTFAPWFAAGVAPSVRVRLVSHLSVWLGVEVLGAVTRPPFFMKNLDVLHEPEPLTLRGWGSLEWSFD